MVRPNRFRILIATVLLIVVEIFVWVMYRGPSPVGNTPTSENGGTLFSAENAIELHKTLLPPAPHPSGSPENIQTRERIAEWLVARGWTVEIQTTTRPSQHPEFNRIANIVAHRPEHDGLNATPVVLSTHYDSCQFGPGAGDAGGCVVAVLEASQCLINQNLSFQRPLWLLITDGEEDGLFGAQMFVQEHPLSQRKPYVLNFDARGNSGPVVMYETHARNLTAINSWISHIAAPRVTGSPFTAIYRSMPNGTDFSVFSDFGWSGMNFAVIDGAHHYHRPTDTVENLSHRSVQQFGNQITSLVPVIATTTSELPAAGDDAVFFDLIGTIVIRYPMRASAPLALAILAVTFVVHWRRLRTQPRVGTAFAALVATALLNVTVSAALGWALTRFLQETRLLPVPYVFWGHYLSLLIFAVIFGTNLVTGRWILRRFSMEQLWTSQALGGSLLAVIAAFLIPDFSHLFAIPMLVHVVLTILRTNEFARGLGFLLGFSVMVVPVQHLISVALGPAAGLVMGVVYSTTSLAMLSMMGSPELGRRVAHNEILVMRG
ncbi:MAG: M28 family peptidase [Planctomyces sp.]|nr:M28 family peptidase [Planctomyces sp.]